MSAAESSDKVEHLLRDFRLYDETVDIVSAWEMLFTASDTALPAQVRHFERFPSVLAPDGNPATPDFAVVFEDATGLVVEKALIAQTEESVEALSEQLLRYDSLTQLPLGGGAQAAVTSVDVMLLVPLDLGTAVVHRLIPKFPTDESGPAR